MILVGILSLREIYLPYSYPNIDADGNIVFNYVSWSLALDLSLKLIIFHYAVWTVSIHTIFISVVSVLVSHMTI